MRRIKGGEGKGIRIIPEAVKTDEAGSVNVPAGEAEPGRRGRTGQEEAEEQLRALLLSRERRG